MTQSVSEVPQIREDVLRNPRYPVHAIADDLLPYLKVLADQFHPEQVMLFGSYANGVPTRDSDVDLLIVKDLAASSLATRRAILKAWRPVRWSSSTPLPIELLVVSQFEHQARIAAQGSFYKSITTHGLPLM